MAWNDPAWLTEPTSTQTIKEGADNANENFVYLKSRADQVDTLGDAAFKDVVGTFSSTPPSSTDPVIERGSNSNGEYVKFADGTFQGWKTLIDIVTESNGTVTQHFPVSINASYSVFVDYVARQNTGTANIFLECVHSVNASRPTYKWEARVYEIDPTTDAITRFESSTVNEILLFVEGRWY